jgi:hypothetical protein
MVAEAGHAPNRAYTDRDGNVHLNGASLLTAAEQDLAAALNNAPVGFTMTPAQSTSNVTDVSIQVTDGNGTALTGVFQFDLWLSDSTLGLGHTTVSASGTVTSKTAGGLVVATQVSKKALTVQTLSTGIFVLEITDSAKTAFKVCARSPLTGKTVNGVTLATGNYG